MTLDPEGWWFCRPPPAREEIRKRFERESGQVVTYFSCEHGTWNDLSAARRAHAITVELPEPLGIE